MYAFLFGFVRALQTVVNNFLPPAISSLLGILPYVTILVVLVIIINMVNAFFDTVKTMFQL